MSHSAVTDLDALVDGLRGFDAELVEVRPRGGLTEWPDALNAGPRTVDGLAPCVNGCERTWAAYGGVAYCRACAIAAATAEEPARWQTALATPARPAWERFFEHVFDGCDGLIELR